MHVIMSLQKKKIEMGIYNHFLLKEIYLMKNSRTFQFWHCYLIVLTYEWIENKHEMIFIPNKHEL